MDTENIAAELARLAQAAGASPAVRTVPGMRIDFDSFDAVAGVTGTQAHLVAAAAAGQLLRLDALQGCDLTPEMLGAEMRLDLEGWYGVVPGVFTVGPFERKSQAMNGLVLAIAGLPVVPERAERLHAEDAQPAAAAEPTWADVVDVSDVPEQLRGEALAEAAQGFAMLGVSTPGEAIERGMHAKAVRR